MDGIIKPVDVYAATETEITSNFVITFSVLYDIYSGVILKLKVLYFPTYAFWCDEDRE